MAVIKLIEEWVVHFWNDSIIIQSTVATAFSESPAGLVFFELGCFRRLRT